jgi:SAM-dependent methyltransferase
MNTSLFDASAAEFASATDRWIALNAYARGQIFIEALSRYVEKGGRILDFGCGPGRISVMAANAGYEVDGVDTSPGMIMEAAKQECDPSRLRFRLCDGVGDDLTTNVYQAVICSSVIEYVAEADHLLTNFARTVKPRAILALSYVNKRSVWRAYALLRFARHLPHYSAQCNIWTPAEVQKRLSNAGFCMVEKPRFLEAAPFDKRPILRRLSACEMIGTLGFVIARRSGHGEA